MSDPNQRLPAAEDPPLDETDRLLTGWVDGELTPVERARFDQLVADDPQLAIEAAAHKELLDLTRSAQLLEPSDRETRRFWSRFYNRGEWRMGWMLLLMGALLLAGYAVVALWTSDLDLLIKIGVSAVLVGGGILCWNTFRLRLRTSRFDRYRGVMY